MFKDVLKELFIVKILNRYYLTTGKLYSGKEPTCHCGRHKMQVRSLDWNIPWRTVWQPSPVVFPGEPHGQRSQVGYNPYSRKESDMTEAT